MFNLMYALKPMFVECCRKGTGLGPGTGFLKCVANYMRIPHMAQKQKFIDDLNQSFFATLPFCKFIELDQLFKSLVGKWWQIKHFP